MREIKKERGNGKKDPDTMVHDDSADRDDQRDDTGAGKIGRRALLGGLAGAAAGGLLLAGTSPAKAASDAWKQPGNNNHILGIQHQDLSADAEAAVRLDYYSHCSFKVTSPKGVTLLVDPWRDDPSGAWGFWFKKPFPKLVVDVCMSTHTHFDHDAIYRPDATTVLDRMIGEFQLGDIRIKGIADKHACSAPGWYKWTNAIKEFGQNPCPPNNPGHMDMAVFVVETGGVRIVFWGDNRHNPPASFWKALGPVDVLTLPVDGSQHILSYDQGDMIVAKLKPKIVIPTHYLNEETTYTLSTLQPADAWVARQKNKRTLTTPTLTLNRSEIAGMDREFRYFGNHVLKA